MGTNWRSVGEFSTKEDADVYCDSNCVSIRKTLKNQQIFRCRHWKLYNCSYQILVKRTAEHFVVKESNCHTHDEVNQLHGLTEYAKETIDSVIEKLKYNQSIVFSYLCSKGFEVEKTKVTEYCRYHKLKKRTAPKQSSREPKKRVSASQLQVVHDEEVIDYLERNIDRPGLYKRFISENSGFGLFTASAIRKGEYIAGTKFHFQKSS